ncbi:MAG: hypothetical protein WD751_03165 [Anaerolineales bacterium]
MSDDPIKKKKEMFGENGQQDSKLILWLRRIGVALMVVLVLVLLVWFVLILPKTNEVTQLQGELATAQAQVASLETEVASLEAVKPEREILSLLALANAARFEVSGSRWDAARAALLPASGTIDRLAVELGDGYAGTIADLDSRLELAKDDIQAKGRTAALGDLDIFVGILEDLLASLQTN